MTGARQIPRDSAPRGALSVWAIHYASAEYPGKFVVSVSYAGVGEVLVEEAPRAVAETLEEARAALPRGLCRMEPLPDDSVCLVETWL